MIVIQPKGGLCNYLRVIFSYYSKCCKENSELVVIWIKTSPCPGYFLDYFTPIDKVTFYESNIHGYNIDYDGCEPLNGYPPNYEKLQLLKSIQSIVNSRRGALGDYIAVHIRRTEHSKHAKLHNSHTDDVEFMKFINRTKGTRNLYIATDNAITFDFFKNKYNDSVIFKKYHKTQVGLRQTTLHDSIIDLFMCVYAAEFKGSGWSSFSILIEDLRNLI